MRLADLIEIPDATQALLWDMDGVLIDSLTFDHAVCTELLHRHCGVSVTIPAEVIRAGFALSPPDFWRYILQTLEIKAEEAQIHALLEEYEQARRDGTFPLLPGVETLLEAARAAGMKLAVVSNNAQADVVAILERSHIADRFDVIVGNDLGQFKKKPAPDTYLHAAERLGVSIDHCVVIEDSLVGVEAGARAGAFTLAVATGGTTLTELERSGFPSVCYQRLVEPTLKIAFGDVRNKHLESPNDFASHMVEHIAWRLGVRIEMRWPNTDWTWLGRSLGTAIRAFPALKTQAAALGMIDDGSAEVLVDIDTGNVADIGLKLTGIESGHLDWFLATRCEQIDSGRPLVDMMRGLAAGLGAELQVRVCSVEDPHHAWEGVFRSIGIALSRLFMPESQAPTEADAPVAAPATPTAAAAPPTAPTPAAATEAGQQAQGQGRITVRERSPHHAAVYRETAESLTDLRLAWSTGQPQVTCSLSVADSIDVSAFPQALTLLAEAAGFDLDVTFSATRLSSSHVVLEDIGLVLGRALLEIFQLRMETIGANGAGGSLHTAKDFHDEEVQVGASIEGRKFVKFVPFRDDMQTLRERFLVGQDVLGTLRTEDLDDFLDGFAGGLSCSLMVHIRRIEDADAMGQAVLVKLGQALRETFAYNPYRKGVPAGVKATLV